MLHEVRVGVDLQEAFPGSDAFLPSVARAAAGVDRSGRESDRYADGVSTGLTFINADIGGAASTLRIVESRIAAVGADPQPGDRVIDLQGDRLLPGLINAHDHLQLNNFGRLKYREHYGNVRDWITDVAAQVQANVTLKACGALSRDQRRCCSADQEHPRWR